MIIISFFFFLFVCILLNTPNDNHAVHDDEKHFFFVGVILFTIEAVDKNEEKMKHLKKKRRFQLLYAVPVTQKAIERKKK